MSLGSPWMLLCLAVVPLLVLAYVRLVRRRSRRADRLASEGLVPTTVVRAWAPLATPRSVRAVRVGARPRLRRARRPTMSFALPQREGTVILAFDVSNSMRADDLEPTRIEAAKAAATAFAERQPSTIRIGVVAFGDSAVTVLRPTNVKEEVVAAIRRLSVSGGTSLGQGLFTSLSTIAGEAAADRRVRAGERRRRGRHRVLRLVGDRPALGRGEHVAPRPPAARRGRVLGGRPRPRDRDRDPGRDGRGGRRVQASRRRSTRNS